MVSQLHVPPRTAKDNFGTVLAFECSPLRSRHISTIEYGQMDQKSVFLNLRTGTV